ncbi:MAG: FxsA family protein [Paracoccaceae bacterium]
MWLFALFVAVPLIEIALFIKVGGWLTLWPSLAIVLATGFLGIWLIKRQGRQVLDEMRGSMNGRGNPIAALAHGGMILIAGVLLILPGFLTDTLGLLLLIPFVRRGVIILLAKRVNVQGFEMRDEAHRNGRDDVIEGEFVELNAPDDRSGASGWTRH